MEMGNVNSGPIPGADATSDTKNYPWHQSPKYKDVDDALDFLTKKVTDFKTANAILTMVEMGITVVKTAQIILMQGMSAGYWTMDYCLLLVGPFTRMLELICIGFDVKYDLGIEDDPNDFQTGEFFKQTMDIKSGAVGGFKILKDQVGDIKSAADGQDGGGTSAPAAPGTSGGDTPPTQEQPLQQGGFMAMTQPTGKAPK